VKTKISNLSKAAGDKEEKWLLLTPAIESQMETTYANPKENYKVAKTMKENK
jgi:hypothetical protein